MKVSIIYIKVWVIRSRRMGLMGHAVHVGRNDKHMGVFKRNLKERDHFEEVG
jgi:hypothetical protein